MEGVPVCEVYACDSYDTAVRSLSPEVYYPMTGGLSDTSAISNPIGTGDYVWDQAADPEPTGLNNLIVEGTGNNVNTLATGPLDGCVETGTAFRVNDNDFDAVRLKTFRDITLDSRSGDGTFTLLNQSTTGSGILMSIQWRGLIDATTTTIEVVMDTGGTLNFLVRKRCYDIFGNQISNCGVTDQQTDIATPSVPYTIQARWKYSEGSNSTKTTLHFDYDFNNPVVEFESEGQLNAQGTKPNYIIVLGSGSDWTQGSYFGIWEKALEPEAFLVLKNGYDRNFSDYSDPRLPDGCILPS
jgi:hypothetical protein